MDNCIDFRTSKTEEKDLRERLKNEIDWLEICGWAVIKEGDGLRLRMAGRPDKVVRNGVIHHG